MSFVFNPFTSNFDIDTTGEVVTTWKEPVANAAALPGVGNTDGDARVALDTRRIHIWSVGSSNWLDTGTTIDSFDTTSTANGLSISAANLLKLHAASATHPGGVSVGAQTLAGAKTFTSVVNADAGVDRSNAGTLAIGTTNATTINIGNAGATVNITGTVNNQNVTNLNVTDSLITINDGGAAGSASGSGIEVEENAIATGYVKTSADRASWELKAPASTGVAAIVPGNGGITLNQSSHDSVTLNTLGSSPNGSGASLSNQSLTLQPADATNPGLLTSGAQSIGGNKTFTGSISASNLSGTNTGDVTLAAVGSSPNANAASLSGQQLTLQPADATNPGVVTTGAQTIAGTKTFSGNISAANLSGTNTGDVTVSDTDSIDLTLASQALSAALKLSSDAASASNLKATTTVKTGAGAGLHVEVPHATDLVTGVVTTAAQTFAGDKTFNAQVLLNALTADKALYLNLSKQIATSTVTTQELERLSGVTDSVQDQLNARTLQTDFNTHLADTTAHGTTGNVVGTTDTQTLTNKTINADLNTLSNIANAQIKAAAAIALNKLAALTGDTAVITDASGFLISSSVTATELSRLSGVTSNIQTQLNGKQASGNYITELTGDVTATGPGSVAATVVQVGGLAAASVASGATAANNAVSTNTASRIVLRDVSGNFSAGTITASLTGAASLNVLKAGDTMSGNLTTPAVIVSGESGNGYVQITNQDVTPSTYAAGIKLYSDISNRLSWKSGAGRVIGLASTGLTADRTYSFPDVSEQLTTPSANQAFTNKNINVTTNTIEGGTNNKFAQYNGSGVLGSSVYGPTDFVQPTTGDIQHTSATLLNNQAAAVNVTGLAFANATVRSFECLISTTISATSPLYESFKLHGVQKGSSWSMSVTSVGDDSGVVFSITTAGQVQYTSSSYAGFTAGTFKFRAQVTQV